MNMAPLVMQFHQVVRPVDELVVGLGQRLSVRELLGVLDDFVEDWLKLNRRVCGIIVVLSSE